jgi:hypothetical protein
MLTKLLYKSVHNMPKEYKFTIGQEMIMLCWRCLDGYFEANSLENEHKFPVIKKLSSDFDKLKCRLRMTQEIGAISEKHFVHLQENYIFSIGDQIGGWLNWANEQRVTNTEFVMQG